MSVPLCNYPKPDGTPCGSPVLRGKKLCYYHLRDHKRHEYSAKVVRELDVLGPRLPKMRTLADVQAALYEILTAIADNRIDLKRAGTHLFALQNVSAALRKPRRTARN